MSIADDIIIRKNVERLRHLCGRLAAKEVLSLADQIWLAEYASGLLQASYGILSDVRRWSDPKYCRRIRLEKALRKDQP